MVDQIAWLCTDEESGPDIGARLHLGNNVWLYAGEISRPCWENGGDAKSLGTERGWWLRLENEAGDAAQLIGPVNQCAALDMFDALTPLGLAVRARLEADNG